MSQPMSNFRCGYAALLGRPNVGKSTLLNKILGTRIAAVSPKAQTTRRRLRGVFTDNNMQAIFVDTPGIHLVPEGKNLNKYCLSEADDGIADADVLTYIIDTSRVYQPSQSNSDEFLVRKMLVRSQKRQKRPLIILLNKVDFQTENKKEFISQSELQESLAELDATAILPVSGRTGEGVEEYLKVLRGLLPQADALYPPDDLTDMNMREIAAELIQEQLFLLLGDELPYSCAVEVVKYTEPQEGQRKTEIQVNIHVERESQKPILIGKGGTKIKEIGMQARKRIEEVLAAPVILKLFVKINPAWTENEKRMRELGYLLPRKK